MLCRGRLEQVHCMEYDMPNDAINSHYREYAGSYGSRDNAKITAENSHCDALYYRGAWKSEKLDRVQYKNIVGRKRGNMIIKNRPKVQLPICITKLCLKC